MIEIDNYIDKYIKDKEISTMYKKLLTDFADYLNENGSLIPTIPIICKVHGKFYAYKYGSAEIPCSECYIGGLL